VGRTGKEAEDYHHWWEHRQSHHREEESSLTDNGATLETGATEEGSCTKGRSYEARGSGEAPLSDRAVGNRAGDTARERGWVGGGGGGVGRGGGGGGGVPHGRRGDDRLREIGKVAAVRARNLVPAFRTKYFRFHIMRGVCRGAMSGKKRNKLRPAGDAGLAGRVVTSETRRGAKKLAFSVQMSS